MAIELLQLNFGEGKIAVSAARRLADNVLILERSRGAGEIGAPVETRPAGSLILPDDGSVILSFKNAESVQVVIDELLNVKNFFGQPLSERDTARLEGAHEVLGIVTPGVA
jgi:hypothetical protein